jgi:hypothetical protein
MQVSAVNAPVFVPYSGVRRRRRAEAVVSSILECMSVCARTAVLCHCRR